MSSGEDGPAAQFRAYAAWGPRSEIFDVTVGGTSVPVMRFGDIDYLHFACSGRVNLKSTRLDGIEVESCRVRPERLSIASDCDADIVTLIVKPGQKLVINVDRLRKLLVFAELPERNLAGTAHADVVNIVECGADPTGRTDSTRTIQAAINSLPADGVLYFPPGRYRSGSLQLKSDMTLHLAGGALLKGSDDHRRFRHYRDGSYLYFLLADGLENVRITGRGTIDGNG